MYVPLPVTGTVDEEKGGRAQVASSGPYTLKVISPVGLNPPLNVAESETVRPDADAWVVRVGTARLTTTASFGSSHGVLSRVSLLSRYSATHR